jgi:hypothetical protein
VKRLVEVGLVRSKTNDWKEYVLFVLSNVAVIGPSLATWSCGARRVLPESDDPPAEADRLTNAETSPVTQHFVNVFIRIS